MGRSRGRKRTGKRRGTKAKPKDPVVATVVVKECCQCGDTEMAIAKVSQENQALRQKMVDLYKENQSLKKTSKE